MQSDNVNRDINDILQILGLDRDKTELTLLQGENEVSFYWMFDLHQAAENNDVELEVLKELQKAHNLRSISFEKIYWLKNGMFNRFRGYVEVTNTTTDSDLLLVEMSIPDSMEQKMLKAQFEPLYGVGLKTVVADHTNVGDILEQVINTVDTNKIVLFDNCIRGQILPSIFNRVVYFSIEQIMSFGEAFYSPNTKNFYLDYWGNSSVQQGLEHWFFGNERKVSVKEDNEYYVFDKTGIPNKIEVSMTDRQAVVVHCLMKNGLLIKDITM